MTIGDLIAKLSEYPQSILVTALDEDTDLPFEYKGELWSLRQIGLREGVWWWVEDTDPEWQAHTFDEVQEVLVIDPESRLN